MLTALLLLSTAHAGKIKVGPVDLPDTLGQRTVPMSDFIVPDARCEGTVGHMVVEVLPDELKYRGQPIASVTEGTVAPSEGLLLPALRQGLQADLERRQAAMKLECMEWTEHSLLLAVDESVPWSVTASVLYTGGQAGIARFAMLVADPDPVGRWQPPQAMKSDGPPLGLTIAITETGLTVLGASERIPAFEADDDATLGCDGGCGSADNYDWSGLLALLSDVKAAHPTETTAVIVPDNGAPAVLLERLLPIVLSAGFPQLTFAAGEMEDSGRFGTVWSTPRKVKLDPAGEVPVVVATLPAIPEPTLLGSAHFSAVSSALKGDGGRDSIPTPTTGVPVDDGLGWVDTSGEPSIVGDLTVAQVRAGVQEGVSEIRFCYARVLAQQPALAGETVHRLTIAADGAVTKAFTKSSTLGDETVETCINRVLGGLTFTEPSGAGVVMANVPLAFAPQPP